MRLVTPDHVSQECMAEFWDRIRLETMFHPFSSEDDFFCQVNNVYNIWWFLVINDRIAGMSMIRGWVENWGEKILGVCVVPEYRGKGLATLLILAAIEEAREQGVKGIRLHVHPNNGPGITLYIKLGFLRSNEMHNGEYVMRKYI